MERDWMFREGMWECETENARGMVAPGRGSDEWIAWIVGKAGLRPAGQGFLSVDEAKAWVEDELGLCHEADETPVAKERRQTDRRQMERRETYAEPLAADDRRLDRRRYDDHWLSSVMPNDAERRRGRQAS